MSNHDSNQLFLTIPVVDILSWYGKRVDHRGYMYYSPFRDEAAPSMRVTVNPSDGTWIWADFGGSPSPGRKVDGGGVLHLVCRLEGLNPSSEADLAKAAGVLRQIASSKGVAVIETESLRERRRAARPAGIVVDRVDGTFTRRNLVNYMCRVRGVPRQLLESYCRQVTYHYRSDSSRRFTVVGFPNNAGGYTLRGTGEGSKKNYLSGISTFAPDGSHRPDGAASGGGCALFEGFVDFLSWLAWRGETVPGMDVCVLNSTANVGQAKDWILAHGVVRTFFDNDNAGGEATDAVRSWCEESGLDFKDGRAAYRDLNDINDAWRASVAASREPAAGGTTLRP